MRRTTATALALGILMFSADGWAVSRVTIESRTVAPGDTAVTIGVYLENTVNIVGLVLPLEVRSLDKGAFIAKRFVLTAGHRLEPWTKGSSFQVTRYVGGTIRRDQSESCQMVAANVVDTALDFESPDAVLYSCVGVSPPAIGPGDDGVPGHGTPSVVITFDVTTQPGRFQIDTTCVPPANHIMMVADKRPFDMGPDELEFEKGIITIAK